MKKWLIIFISILILSGVTGSAGAADNNQEPTFSGVYNVIFSTDQGQNYPVRIIIQDLKNGKVEASGDYNGYPITITGDVTGSSENGGTVCSFTVNKAGLVMGNAEIKINSADGEYKLSGNGSGSYSFGKNSGQISGKVTGSRKSPITSSDFFTFKNAVSAAAGAVLIAALIFITWIYRRRKRISINKVLNARVLRGRKAAEYLAHYGYLSEQGDGNYKLTKSGRTLAQGKEGLDGQILKLAYEGDPDDFIDTTKISIVVSHGYNSEMWD